MALKVLAHRVGEDEDDVRLLADHLGLGSAGEVLAIAESTYGDRLDAAARFFVEEIYRFRVILAIDQGGSGASFCLRPMSSWR